MKETAFIPVEEVFPQEELVAGWLKQTQNTLNDTLKTAASIESDFQTKQYQQKMRRRGRNPGKGRFTNGYEKIDGQDVFTGVGYCNDTVAAYGEVLSTIPIVKDLGIVVFSLIAKDNGFINTANGSKVESIMHMALSFRVGEQEFFVDPTHGQVARKENTLLVHKVPSTGELFADFLLPAYPEPLGALSFSDARSNLATRPFVLPNRKTPHEFLASNLRLDLSFTGQK